MMAMAQPGKVLLSEEDGLNVVVLMFLPLSSEND